MKHIKEILGESVSLFPVSSRDFGSKLPLFMTELYSFSKVVFMQQTLFLFEPKEQGVKSMSQLLKHQELIEEKLLCKTALVLEELEAFQRKRLIEKKAQFIIPGRQIFLPFWLVDLKETFIQKRKKRVSISPAAQMILIWYILDRERKIDFSHANLQDLANDFGYSAMTITKASTELVEHGLCTLKSDGKHKFMQFSAEKLELWHLAEPHLVNPVLKTIYVDQLPNGIGRIASNFSALSEYSEMNPSRQKFYAIDKSIFYQLEKEGAFRESNETEGEYCLEVWKYNPSKFCEILSNAAFAVDPLSLYLSMKGNPNERADFAVENLLNHIW